jgi:hypothetical protein
VAPTLGPFLRLYLSGRGPPRLWVAIWVANRDRQLDGPTSEHRRVQYHRWTRFRSLYERFPVPIEHLQLADKAARTVVLLTERLDHHRGRGQQQITVKHVTTTNVTADQAIIADSVTTGGAARNVASPALLAASFEAPMPILDEARLPDPVGVGGGTKSK